MFTTEGQYLSIRASWGGENVMFRTEGSALEQAGELKIGCSEQKVYISALEQAGELNM
jgi:hypothetical protein